MIIRKLRRFHTKGACACIGVLLLLTSFHMHNYPNKSDYKNTKLPESVCRKYHPPSSTTLTGFIQRRENNLIYYCDVPKCGSAFMKNFFAEAFSCRDCYYKKVNLPHKRKQYKYVKHKIENSTYSFMFVREPYSRLFSIFENKLYRPNEQWGKLGVDVIKVVRENATKLCKQYGYDVTFVELVRYLVTLYEKKIPLNIHLVPIHKRCNPCNTRFDFIGKQESMTSDLIKLVSLWKKRGINVDFESSVDVKELELKSKRDFGAIMHMFTMLSRFPDLPRHLLYQRLWSSYQMRGLILNNQIMPFRQDLVDDIDMLMYELAIKDAIEQSAHEFNVLQQQRKDALMKAYRTVPMDLLLSLRNVLKIDCELFGYDVMPESIFNRTYS
ncbi:carbohydrate sulfotransferase 8-like [Ruditapes philippinarum]|uniref:carbohydrate sulfotransferase 8-like n=1 Tax=Ruditapes philippinarum TaxID=129788 RepID=UPI00295C27AD|nr:carbohydrate sulfotransferase 8-like [Ruditapes philippinarum]